MKNVCIIYIYFKEQEPTSFIFRAEQEKKDKFAWIIILLYNNNIYKNNSYNIHNNTDDTILIINIILL